MLVMSMLAVVEALRVVKMLSMVTVTLRMVVIGWVMLMAPVTMTVMMMSVLEMLLRQWR